jgi:cobalt/nickel transport system permease protein
MQGVEMHIAEGYLPPLHALAWWAASLPFLRSGAKQAMKICRDGQSSRLQMGLAAAFTLTLTSLRLPSVAGSCSHPTGIGLSIALFPPGVMAAIGFAVLLLQALLLAHGGLTTLGANMVSMAIVGPWMAYGTMLLAKKLKVNRTAAIALCVVVGNLATYSTTALQLALVFPDPHYGVGGALAKFLGVFAVTQIPVSMVEALVTVLVLRAATLENWRLRW